MRHLIWALKWSNISNALDERTFETGAQKNFSSLKSCRCSLNMLGAFHFRGGVAGNKAGEVGKERARKVLCQAMMLLSGF